MFLSAGKMKLRVRLNKQTSRVELEGPEPTLSQLSTRVREQVLPSAGLSRDGVFQVFSRTHCRFTPVQWR
ncbi:hypothetical protein C0J50_12139 [Silurus asotus]|uniref:Uncharacterized protein n=1 Tax=Silurus asotus TaxID=30991 RepID=A0AAD5A554_SILAS|nr:hypothetical protein C0J50_12139 [Silurus asotus]